MYPRILIPTDGSACGGAAVHEGLALAKELGSHVTQVEMGDTVTLVAKPHKVHAFDASDEHNIRFPRGEPTVVQRRAS